MDTEKLNIVREEPAACRIKLNVEVPSEEVDKTFTEVDKTFTQNIEIPGFRKGKAPRSLLKQKYGDKIKEEVKDRIVRESLMAAVEQEKLQPLTNPAIVNEEQLEIKRGESVVFAVEFDVPPQFELPDYKNIKLEKEASEVQDETIENVITNVLQSRASYEKADRPAQAGDLLKASYRGKLADEPEEEMPETAKYLLEAEETWLNLSQPEVLPGITEKLEGAEAGSEYNITIEFPDDFYESQLAGKKAEYTVTVHEVQASQTPELTDELAREFGADTGEQLRGMIKDHISSDMEKRQQDKLRNDLTYNLVDQTEMELPPKVFAREKQRMLQEIYQEKMQNGNSEEDLQQQQDELNKEAEARARTSLKRYFILDRIAKEEGVDVQDEDIQKMMSSLSSHYNIPAKQLLKRLKENDGIYEVINNIRENKTIEHLLSIADIEEKASEDDSTKKSSDGSGKEPEQDKSQ